eukprot:880191-Rhodomonas_salina.1
MQTGAVTTLVNSAAEAGPIPLQPSYAMSECSASTILRASYAMSATDLGWLLPGCVDGEGLKVRPRTKLHCEIKAIPPSFPYRLYQKRVARLREPEVPRALWSYAPAMRCPGTDVGYLSTHVLRAVRY